MTTDPGRCLETHGAALRGLARALVGGGDADDLLQDGYVAALQGGVRDVADVRSWLAAVLRRLAGKRRRRRLLELRCASTAVFDADRRPAAPGAAEQAAQRETIARLDAELLALPEPYRAALLARYYEALPPAAIAARDGVPLATVKSRLQRGLLLLRARFDEVDGADWRRGMVAAFGLERTAVVGTAAVAITGAMLMSTWTKVAIVLVLAGAFAWFAGDAAWRGAPAGAAAPEPGAAAVARASAQPHSAEPGAPSERTPVAASPAAPVRDASVSVRGRCVDERGAPLAGVTVSVCHRDPWRFDEHELAAPVTGADGTFAAAFAVPPSRAVAITCRAPGLVAVAASLQELGAGSEHDLGDLPLAAGCVVTGHVLDDRGAPVLARVRPIELDHRDREPTPLFGDARTDAAGAFTLPLFVGTYRFVVDGERVLTGERLEIADGARAASAVITVQSGLPRIRGLVVDTAGVPVPGAKVTGNERDVGGYFASETGADGAFVLQRNVDGQPGPVELRALARGLEHVRVAEPVAWNGEPVRIELPASLALELRVVHDTSAAPVEDYGVRLAVGRLPYASPPPAGPFAGATVQPGEFDVPRAVGHHDHGVLVLDDLRRDVYVLCVEPLDPALAPSAPQLVELADGTRSVRLALSPRGRRAVELVRPDGEPVAGCRIELCDPFRGEVTPRSRVVSIAEVSHFQVPDVALLLQAARTDAGGRCELDGPTGRPLALRVMGPRCIPMVSHVRVDGSGALRITVDPGARLRVQASPADVLPKLRALRTLEPGDDAPVVGMRLRGAAARFPERTSPPVPFDANGTAVLSGAPPGTWRLFIEWQNAQTTEERELGEVVLASARETHFALDLAPLRPATLRATVTLNGQPFANRDVELTAARQHRLRTDADGRLVFTGTAGSYRLRTELDQGRGELGGTSPVTLRPGDAVEAEVALKAGALAVQFVDADGKPVAGVHEARLLSAANDCAATLPDSDEDGRAARPLLQAGALHLFVMPRRYADIAAKQRYLADHPEDPGFRSIDLDLGLVAVEAGRDNVATVTLPAAYFR
ncbi:MAG TPA: sigma-70 family RNA polymerase sigma factor [Planctomycetota bacterium]|nr:sigma-70 family RNA polymerase sigma factor [Planctomycetota bacterium]